MTSSDAFARSRGRGAWLALLVVFLGWSGWFVYRTSFVVEGDRYFSLFDDAMISSSYAMNLVEGRGLRWDGAIEPVEGFTNPLWTFAMALSHLPALPVRYRSLVMQVLCLALLVLNLFLVKRLMERHFGASEDRPSTWIPACVLTAGFYPLAYWSLMGMETALQACFATLGTLLALDVTSDGRRVDRAIQLGGVWALAYLTRMDMILWVLLVIGYLWWRRPGLVKARRSWIALGILVAAAGGYQLFRMIYFGDVLPNPYYLKMWGIPIELRLARGGATTLRGLGAALPLMLLGAIAAHRWRDRRPALTLVVAPVWIYALYSVWVGGDAWERAGIGANRFLAWTMPLLFVGLNGAWTAYGAPWTHRRRAAWTALVTALALPALLVVPGTEGTRRIGDLLVLRPPFQVEEHARVLESFLLLERYFPSELSVTTVFAGIPAVYTEFRLVDFLGYTDPWLAKQPAAMALDTLEPERYEPGHVKWDLTYVLDRKRPDIVLHTFGIPRDRIVPELERRGYREVRGLWLAPWTPSPFDSGEKSLTLQSLLGLEKVPSDN